MTYTTKLLSSAALAALLAGPSFAQDTAKIEADMDADVEVEATEDAERLLEEGEDAVSTAATETGEALEDGADAVADAATATGEAVEDGVEKAGAMTADAVDETQDWVGKLNAEFAEIADWSINELEGRDVASTNGEIIGEIDEVGTQNGELVAVVGVGGFIGLGEHDVALELSKFSWDGEKFIADGYTEEELKDMAEYDEDMLEPIEGDVTLRTYADS